MMAFCDSIGMERHDLHFWDYEDEPEERERAPDHLAGISAVQFIATSNITIHTLDRSNAVFIDAFTCNDALDLAEDQMKAVKFSASFWQAGKHEHDAFARGWI
jgi:S-adenosylmethionine/arginine decarboxylase-like enzyme